MTMGARYERLAALDAAFHLPTYARQPVLFERGEGMRLYDDQGRELKSFDVKDGLGVVVLGRMGIGTLLLTAKDGKIVHQRGKDMRALEVIAGVLPKEKMLTVIEEKYKIKRENICFIGDDWIDIGMIEQVGVGVAVADAPAIVKKSAVYVTKNKGGEGAVREVIDLILKAQKLEGKVMELIRNPSW